jgi:RNase P protein component
MKNKTNAAQRNRSFRRLVRQWFSSLLKRQNGDYLKKFEKVMEKLQDIEDSIEIIAREIARQI